MLILAVTTGAGVLAGLIGWLATRSLSHSDTGAPHVDPSTVESGVRKHPGVARWLRHHLDPTVATGSLLLAAGAVIVAGGGLVWIVLEMVRANVGFARFDTSAARFGAQHATTASTDVLRVITQLGGAAVIVPVALVVGVIQARRHRSWGPAAFLAIVVGGQFLLANTIKALVDRTRPNLLRLTGFSGPSFPSGHATASAAVFAALALLFGLGRPRSTKAVLAGVAIGLAVMVSATRVLLGVHWLTDVTAGLFLGWAWFALCSIAFGGRLLRFGAPVEAAERAAAQVPEPAART